MTTSTEQELRDHFDRALHLRDEGELRAAVDELLLIVAKADEAVHRKLLSHSHMQLGHIFKKLDQPELRERHFCEAARIEPRSELASLGLFHARWALGLHEDALREARRYCSLSNSEGYRDLLSEGFREDLPDAEYELAEGVRELLRRFA
jgi:hypothetical protein